MPKFKLGDVVWTPHVGNVPVEIPCPVCFGKKAVIVVLGNDDQVEVQCEFCGGNGLQDPKGVITVHEHIAEERKVHIDSITIKQTAGGEEIEYQDGCHLYREDQLFLDPSEANAKAKELAERQNDEDLKRSNNRKKFVTKTAAWNAGYWLREAKRLREDMERAEARAKVLSEKAKPKPKV